MEDGLETKAPSFLEKQENQNKEESAVKSCILILDGQKVVKINPKLEINHSQDIDGMY